VAAVPVRVRRSAPERLQAWFLTGPVGHLWSAVADVVELWARWQIARARGTAPR